MVVGGQGITAVSGSTCSFSSTTKPYNGGTAASCQSYNSGYGSGGGATHIAKAGGNYTTLSSYGNATTAANYVYIVAGGGGGAGVHKEYTRWSGTGGAGGGTVGQDGQNSSSYYYQQSHGGTQTTAGNAVYSYSNNGSLYSGAFGQGGGISQNSTADAYAGGGGGWYGGAGAQHGAGAGGSGWIGGVTGGTTTAGVQSGNGKAKITNVYTESILNGAYPTLTSNLIPVTIENNGTVKKANLSDEWYKYADKKWANAVVLKDKSISYNDGATIPESNIQSYFVWIPRYKYKLFDLGNYSSYSGTSKPSTTNAKTIDIVFESKNTTASTGNTVGSWLTHPAFTTFNVNGIWVGKFEASGSTSNLEIKPNVSSLRNISVGDFFTSMYNYLRNEDSHMMKNIEWGAVAYLSLSNYGINSEVRINNSSAYTTGCAATVAATNYTNKSQSNHTEGYYSGCENAYNTTTGYLASTTGNISGVYDMSGGAVEYVAGYISGKVGSSGLTPSNYNSKYFDVYNSSSSMTSYNYRILGDATGEMGPFYYYKDSDNSQRYHNNWFADNSEFIDSSHSWFGRGGNYTSGVTASQIGFHIWTGGGIGYISSRLVLAPGG